MSDNNDTPNMPNELPAAASPLSPGLVKGIAEHWLTARLYMEREHAEKQPSSGGKLPEAFLQAWFKFGEAVLAQTPEQFTLFISAVNTLPGHLMVPLIDVSAELELIPEEFKVQLIAKLSLRKNHLATGGLHG